MNRILGKTLKELRADASKFMIKGRSKMDRNQLMRALWYKHYANKMPVDMDEAIEYLALHPNDVVRKMQNVWSIYGPSEIAMALETIASAYDVSRSEDLYCTLPLPKDWNQHANQTIKTAGAYFSMASEALQLVNLNH